MKNTTKPTLSHAIRNHDHDSLRQLLGQGERGIDLPEKTTPMHLAARVGNLPAMKVLQEYGIGPNAVDQHGNTPLHEAARFGQGLAVSRLLLLGALASATDRNGNTALHVACDIARGQNQKLSVRSLLNGEAPVNATNNDGMTPAHYAARSGALEILDSLRERGANLHAVDKQRKSVTDYARSSDASVIKNMIAQATPRTHRRKEGSFRPLG